MHRKGIVQAVVTSSPTLFRRKTVNCVNLKSGEGRAGWHLKPPPPVTGIAQLAGEFVQLTETSKVPIMP